MPVIRLQFVAERWYRDPGSAAIRWFSAGQVSHVDAVIPAALDWGTIPASIAPEGWLFGARHDAVGGKPAGVWERPPGYLPFSHRVMVSVPIVIAGQATAFWRFLRAQRGKLYDTTAVWAFLVARDWREEDSWMCSELVAAAAQEAGIFPPHLFVAANKITPAALGLALSAVPGVTVEVIT